MENLQFGHVKGVMAAVLAPIMDAMSADNEADESYGLTSIDATVPTSPNYYNCNLEVEFWGKDLSQVPALEQALTYDSAAGKKTGIRILDRNPEAPVPESSSSGRKKKGNSKEGDGSHGGVVARTVAVKDWKSQKEVCSHQNELFVTKYESNVFLICKNPKSHFELFLFPGPKLDELFDKQRALLDSLPTAPPPSQLTTKLLPHQAKGLNWLVHREKGNHTQPFWKQVVEKGQNVWLSEITNSSQARAPRKVRGGIVADEMGLGKTLMSLSIVLSNPPPGQEFGPGKDPENGEGDDDEKKPSAIKKEQEEEDGDEYDDRDVPSEAAVKKLKVSQLRSIAMHSSDDLYVSDMKKGALVDAVYDGLEDGSIALKHFYSEVASSDGGSLKKAAPPARPAAADGGVCRATLVVCPVSVMASWTEEVYKHVKPGVLSIDLFQGTHRERLLPLVESNAVDILLVSYQTLAADYSKYFGKDDGDSKPAATKKRKNGSGGASTIFDIPFHRVILDEAHTIRNGKAKATKACLKLKATNRLCLTGTPLQNKPEDIRPLLSFIGSEPLGQQDIFRRAISSPIKSGDDVGLARLRAVMAHFALRRTKEKEGINLTDRTVQVCTVQFPEGSVHQRIYDVLFESARTAFSALLSAGDKEALKEYAGILETLLRIRQACCSGILVPKERLERAEKVVADLMKSKADSSDPLTAEEGKKLLDKLKGIFEESESAECCICLEEFCSEAAMILRSCSHVYCKGCISHVAGMRSHACPLCRVSFEPDDMVAMNMASEAANKVDENPTDEEVETSLADVSDDELAASPKIAALLQSIGQISDESEKGVALSQFTGYLDVIGDALEAAGHSHTRIDGKMNTQKRIAAMADFNSNSEDSPRFILCSLMAAGTGINLTRGNHVFLMDLWWNKAVEDQAMDRCHRVGQERDVFVTKFVMEGSVEERIIQMQDAKYALGKGTLEKLSAQEMRQARVSALCDLFQVEPKGSSSSANDGVE